jgi:hypothetical protein
MKRGKSRQMSKRLTRLAITHILIAFSVNLILFGIPMYHNDRE